MNIRIICVGKIKEKFYREAVAEYSKRLTKFCRLTIIEVPDEKTSDQSDCGNNNISLEREGKRILEKIPHGSYVIALTIDGKMYDSVQLSQRIQSLMQFHADYTLIIGGSLGLWNEVIKRADECVSFSKLTFPHQLMRVILLEQIYRSFKIMHNEPYHK